MFANETPFEKTHDLKVLRLACAKICDGFKDFIRPCAEITTYAVGNRYPNRRELVKHNAEFAIKHAKIIYDFVIGKLNLPK